MGCYCGDHFTRYEYVNIESCSTLKTYIILYVNYISDFNKYYLVNNMTFRYRLLLIFRIALWVIDSTVLTSQIKEIKTHRG